MINCLDCDTPLSGYHFKAQRCGACASKRRKQQMNEYNELRSSARSTTGNSIERRARVAGVHVEEKRRTEELFWAMKQKVEAMK
jgi:hypothetical protein